MDVVLLGTGSADGWPNPFCDCRSCQAAAAEGVIRGQTAALVDNVLLLDCGPEAPRAALRAGRRLDRVRDVLLTHSHPDHTGPSALLWRSWANRDEELTVHGPAAALDACRDWVGPDDPVRFHPIEAGEHFQTAQHTVRALEANHGDAGSGAALLWEVTSNTGSRLLYATDTGWPPPDTLDAMSTTEPYDLVLLEETFGDRDDLTPEHMHLGTFSELLAALRSAGSVAPTTEVVAVHLGHHNPAPSVLDQRLDALGARAGRDGDVLTCGAKADRADRVDGQPRRTLLLGGARSGKSVRAEQLVATDRRVTYVATGGNRPDDAEWAERVELHRSRRPSTWSTRETVDVARVLRSAERDETVLVDCLSVWLADRLDRAGTWLIDPDDLEGVAAARKQVSEDADELLAALRITRARVVLVSNEVGQGVVPETRSGRQFRDELGILNTRVADVVDHVSLVIAGQTLTLKGTVG